MRLQVEMGHLHDLEQRIHMQMTQQISSPTDPETRITSARMEQKTVLTATQSTMATFKAIDDRWTWSETLVTVANSRIVVTHRMSKNSTHGWKSSVDPLHTHSLHTIFRNEL
jgi:hypothetical protein